MPLRFRAQSQNIAIAGTTIAHGLAAIPDEWSFNLRTAQVAGTIYMYSAPTSTSLFLAAATAAASADVFCSVSHSFIE